MSPSFDPTALHTGLSRAAGRAQAAWGVNSDSAFIDAVASESGLLAEQLQLADLDCLASSLNSPTA